MGRDLSYFYSNNEIYDKDSNSDSDDETDDNVSRHNDKIGYFIHECFTRQMIVEKIKTLLNDDLNNKDVREAICVFSMILKGFCTNYVYISYN